MKKIPCSFLCLLFVFGILLPGRLAASVIKENDRIGWSADGNRHDPDDWGATAMALAIFAKQGWQDKLVHIDYNNWLPDNTPFKSAEETISVLEGAKKFKFTKTKIFDNQIDLEAAIDNVVAEINKSGSSSRFWYVQAGPFEVAYLALLKADPDKRKYCILVSHSAANDRPEHWPGQHGKDDCVALGAKYFYTTGQGKEKFGGGRFHEWQLVDWMKNSPNPEYRWVYTRLKKTAEHKNGALDASDGGMAFALATGDLDGNFNPKLRDFLGTDWAEPTFGNPKVDPPNVPPSTKNAFIEEPGRLAASVEYDAQIPQLVFAAQELKDALKEAGRENLQVTLIVKPDESSPEAFQIRSVGPTEVWIIGTDATGAMYGGLEVADLLRLGLPIEDQQRAPFVPKRGIKFNIPWDARTPSYDDTGDAAQKNIETVWDFEFWKAYLDDLARYRYNVLSLWSTHPYPSIIKLEEYPEVALDDVYRISDGIFQPHYKNRLQDLDLDKPGTMKLVKKIPIEKKIKHWQRVFKYAEDRGIEIYLFHWNVMTFGATGKHGITPDQTNPVTVDYMRKSVRQALLTYPQIAGIGVTAGENADNHLEGEYSIENFLFNTYGRGIMDVLEQQPDRKVRFIFRQHMTGLGPITEAFADYPGAFNTSFKYAIGHMYSMPRPLLFERSFRNQVEEYKVPCWFNLRNDDMFVLRWGNPDFVREYIQKMPHHLSPGFYMGSDGYVWGREFIAKNPEMAGRLEIDKHWYRFRQWGQLAYNPFLGRDYWEAVLKHRFPGVDARLLYDAWAATSEIVPQINSANYCPNDAHIAPEGCIAREGFLTVDDYYFNPTFGPMFGSGIHSVTEWGQAVVAGKKLEGITPLQVSDNLDEYAATALAALPKLRKQMGDNMELQETLNDIESMAYLGRYYADKMRGAAKLAAFREDVRQKQFNDEAVAHFKDAVQEWKAYAAIVSSQYKTQLMQRTHFMDWNRILAEVEKEVVAAEREGDYPDIRFTNLKDGARFPAKTGLRVEVDTTDGHGIRDVKLYLNGLLLKAHTTDPQVWSGSSDELLKSLKPGVYHLKAVAEDNTGTVGRREIQIAVGDVSQNSAADWSNEIHQVILNEGERLMEGDVRNFPRLECDFKINEDGRLVLHAVIPGRSRNRTLIWKSVMYKDPQGSHYATLEKGQLVLYRGTPDNPEATPFKTPSVSGTGPFKLGITVSKRLAVFRDEGKKTKIVWMSPVQN